VNRIDEPEGQGSDRTWAPDSGEDLEQASENVLEGWPAPRPAEEDDDGLGDELAFDPAAEGREEPDGADKTETETEGEGEGGAVVWDAAAPPDDVETGVGSEQASVAAPDAGEGSDTLLETSSEHAPGQLVIPPGYAVLEGRSQGRRRAVGVVVSRFNGEVTGRLLESALDELAARGVGPDSITVMPVPGAFELPIAAMALAKTRRFACIVALGCVIRGDTPHFDYVASEAASGLQLAAIETGVPVAFGVLTLDRPDQAEPRFGKGAEAVGTALEMADLFANLRAAAAR
jgi:6,7-dimethyl-8-ribityllumazine synthase